VSGTRGVLMMHADDIAPECNPLLPLWHPAAESKVPAAKSIPIPGHKFLPC
jgi:hypothetical protein